MKLSVVQFNMEFPWDSSVTNDLEGFVLRIERTSIHDGEGLRTVLFLKGCPLSCLWCSTPESQKSFPERGRFFERCVACGVCINNCRFQALSLVNNSVVVDESLCQNCFDCVSVCPQDALRGYGQKMTVGQALLEICKDEIFFFHSGGGVTLSGGECLLQPDFAAGILRGCKLQNINTAVETSLYAPWQHVEKILAYADTLFVDIKHFDSAEHKRYVGVGNELILQNLARLDSTKFDFKLQLRIPLIPGVNDSDETLSGILSLAAILKKVDTIEILPYHRLGVGTYSQLGRTYHLKEIPSPTSDYISERLEFLRKQQPCAPLKIGGGFKLP